MIKKLSDTWKQQKQRNQNDGTPGKSQRRFLGSREIRIQPTEKAPKSSREVDEAAANKNDSVMVGMNSFDWEVNDSLMNELNQLGQEVFSPVAKQPQFTQVTTKAASSTPFQAKKKLPNINAVAHSTRKSARKSTSPKAKSPEEIIKSPNLSRNENLAISNWNLPETILKAYQEKGICNLFQWQQECLLTGSVLSGGNLVYSAPTSAGKTLVAEILMLKRVLETEKKAIYILPYVSVTREKMNSLRDQFEEAGVKVGGFMGSESPPGGFNSVDIAVCTIEKANSLINRLMEEKRLSVLTCVVVDEMHMLGDPWRGYLLELLLTKIRFVSCVNSNAESADEGTVQMIGMSATLPNLNMLASWLKADLYFTDYRPVPLSEHMKIGQSLLDRNSKEVTKLNSVGLVKGDEDGIVSLCIETIQDGNSVLIFCPTKVWCEKLAATISNYFAMHPQLVNKRSHCFQKASDLVSEDSAVDDVVDQLRRSPAGLDDVLHNVVKHGVAYHHAGLTFDERDIVEGAFRRGVLRVLAATSTLSSGVNLPARRVIIRSPIFHGKLLDALVYKQMVGRAGRKGVDTSGESILVCKPSEKQKALSLLTADLKPVYSCLLETSADKNEFKSMKRALLEVIAAGVAVTPKDVECYAQCTYLHTCLSVMQDCDAAGAIRSTMKFLLDNEFISLRHDIAEVEKDDQLAERTSEKYYATQLGSATLASSLSPGEALVVFSELQKARKCFVLENELHTIYQVTPIYLQDQWPDLDWYTYFNLWERLPAQFKYVGELVGVEESFLARAIRNRIQSRTEAQIKAIKIHRRFYAALVLQELVNEVPLPVISKRYKINRGMLQSLQNSAATFAGMVTKFCQKLGWTCLELLLEQFQSRLSFGVSRELCNLVRISLLNAFKARALYENGYQTVSTLAHANKEDIARILGQSVPFESKQMKVKAPKVNARFIWLTGKEGLTEHEAATLIITEAKRILAADAASLGIPIEQVACVSMPSSKRKSTGTRSSNRRLSRSSTGSSDKKKRGRKRPSPTSVSGEVVKKKVSPARNVELSGHDSTSSTSNENAVGPVSVSDAQEKGEKLNSREPLEKVHCEEREAEDHVPDMNQGSPTATNRSVEMHKEAEDDCHQMLERRSSSSLFSDGEGSFELLDGSDSLIKSPGNVSHDNEKGPEENSLCVGEQEKVPVDDENTSTDSMLFVPGSLLKPRKERSVEESESSPVDFSLRLSSSDDVQIEEKLNVPPMRLEKQFEEVVSPAAKSIFLNVGTKKVSDPFSAISISDSIMNDVSQLMVNHNITNTTSLDDNDDFLIIDVASQKELFLTFLKEWRLQKRFSFCFACESATITTPALIGAKMKGKEKEVVKPPLRSGYKLANSTLSVVGIAFCWGQKDAYYLSLEDSPTIIEEQLDNSLLPPVTTKELTPSFRLSAIKSVVSTASDKHAVISFDMKEQLKILFELIGSLMPGSQIEDPKVAHWMLDPDEKPKNLHSLVKRFLSEDFITIAEAVGGGFGAHGLGLVPQSPGSGRVRSCAEAVLCFHLMKVLETRLKDEELLEPFMEIEMPSIRTLAVLEVNGIGFSDQQCENLKDTMKGKLDSIERECYQLASHPFSLTSTDDVARVLFHELCLPHNGNADMPVQPRQTRSKAKTKLRSYSTAKAVLEKLTKYHRLPKLILEWRRVNSALTKVVYPLQRKKTKVDNLDMFRIFSEAQYHTSTGRVTFSEPNLQNVPKEFDIKIPTCIIESPPETNKKKKVHNRSLTVSVLRQPSHHSGQCNSEAVSPGEKFTVSMRSAFVPFDAALFLAVDYSQLELRLIAHLSDDSKLLHVLNSSSDVFKSIAAEVNRVSVDEVTPFQRQHAKQICYGIIYGIGAKALSEQLSVSEDEAGMYMQQFKDRYSGVKAYIKITLSEVKKNGFVRTMAGRKRYLSAINSANANAKAQAERQAVNTTVQGSAADLVKKAMNEIDRKLRQKFGSTCLSRHRKSCGEQRGAFLVLQLHDELIYEVNRKDLDVVREIVKFEMENAYELKVKMPVMLRVGSSWGSLRDV